MNKPSIITIGERRLILGGDPDERFGVPTPADFDRQNVSWLPAQGCQKIAEALIQKLPCFDSLKDTAITYLWKKKGSTSPALLLGKCQRTSGLLKYFCTSEFVVWFSANNCAYLQFTTWQMEALIYHELRHARMEGNHAVIVPHDWEGFAGEIERYGIWKRDIESIVIASARAAQMPLGFKKAGR